MIFRIMTNNTKAVNSEFNNPNIRLKKKQITVLILLRKIFFLGLYSGTRPIPEIS